MNLWGWYGFFGTLLISWIGGCDFNQRGVDVALILVTAICFGFFFHYVKEGL
jgi:hypothetical protein